VVKELPGIIARLRQISPFGRTEGAHCDADMGKAD